MLSEVMPQQSINTNPKIKWWWQQWRTNVPVIHHRKMEEKLVKLAFQIKQYQLEDCISQMKRKLRKL
jgi:hypothetical protein